MRTCLKCGGNAFVAFNTECRHDFGEATDALLCRKGAAVDVLMAGGRVPSSSESNTILAAAAALVEGDLHGAEYEVERLEAAAAVVAADAARETHTHAAKVASWANQGTFAEDLDAAIKAAEAPQWVECGTKAPDAEYRLREGCEGARLTITGPQSCEVSLPASKRLEATEQRDPPSEFKPGDRVLFMDSLPATLVRPLLGWNGGAWELEYNHKPGRFTAETVYLSPLKVRAKFKPGDRVLFNFEPGDGLRRPNGYVGTVVERDSFEPAWVVKFDDLDTPWTCHDDHLTPVEG